MSTYNMTVPIKEEDVRKLKTGDIVFLSGRVNTSRDMGHMKIQSMLSNNETLPFEPDGGVIFHAGPVVVKDDGQWKMSVIGPTTSIRMEPYAEMVGSMGVRMIIGKGGMADGSLKAYNQYGQVYLQAPPGCAVILGSYVKKIENVQWFELGMPEALWEFEVENFGPLIVTMDSHMGSRYKDLKEKSYSLINSWYS